MKQQPPTWREMTAKQRIVFGAIATGKYAALAVALFAVAKLVLEMFFGLKAGTKVPFGAAPGSPMMDSEMLKQIISAIVGLAVPLIIAAYKNISTKNPAHKEYIDITARAVLEDLVKRKILKPSVLDDLPTPVSPGSLIPVPEDDVNGRLDVMEAQIGRILDALDALAEPKKLRGRK